MGLEIKKAVRRALPMQLAFYGPSGSGKTLSALLFAAGLSPNKKIAVADTERGRASLYASNKRVLHVLPNGFDVIELDNPYHPSRYIEAIDLAESKGYEALIIDSGSDSWDGPGGCTDIAEKAKGMWNGAKLWNKRMMTRASLSDMHIIWCLKAQEKTKVVDKNKSASGKSEFIDLGIQPIWEKNNLFPMLLVFSVDPKSHLATVTKCHDDLWDIYSEPRLITQVDGLRLREWNQSGQAVGQFDQLKKRSQTAAEQGMKVYVEFFEGLTKEQKKALVDTVHGDNKKVAENSDKQAREEGGELTPEEMDRMQREHDRKESSK